MQIRFGDYDKTKHKPGFLADGLSTFVPQHLLHNQLRTSDWERQIYARHRLHADKTEIHILHRLFLQYCYQWPFYAATFFDVDLQRHSKRSRSDAMRLAINTEWVSIIHGESNTLKAVIAMDQLTYEAKDTTVTLECTHSSQVAGLQMYIRTTGVADTLVMSSPQVMCHARVTSRVCGWVPRMARCACVYRVVFFFFHNAHWEVVYPRS